MVRRKIFCLVVFLSIFFTSSQPILKADPIIDHYISTGDNHFLVTSLPIEDQNSIEASFDFLKDVWGVRRIYWRGLQELQASGPGPLAYIIHDGAHPRVRSCCNWGKYLYSVVGIEQIAVQAAHDRGIEIWGVGNLFDWGGRGDIPIGTYYGYPYFWESKLRVEHPEWVPVDKYGALKQAGPFELSYPGARQAIINVYKDIAVEAGYDGVFFLTYAENYGLRFHEQFGYNESIVQEFKNRYGIDIRTEPFNSDDRINLRGEYVTQFFSELKAALDPCGIKQGITINWRAPNRTREWPWMSGYRTAGEFNMDYESWINNEIIDELVVYGSGTFAQQIDQLAQGKDTEVSIITSSPYSYVSYGLPVVGSFGDDIFYLQRSDIPDQPISALTDPNPYMRMRILAQIIDGETSATAAQVLPLASDSHMLVRRMAMRALGVIGDPVAVPTLEAGLFDCESAVRNGAVEGLKYIRGSNTAAQLLSASDQFGNFMFCEAAAVALASCTPFSTVQTLLADTMQNHSNPMVRETAAHALARYMYNSNVVSAFINVLWNDPCDNIRQYAAQGLGNISNSSAGVQALIDAVALDNVAVSERAVQALGKKGSDPAAMAVKSQIIDVLRTLYEKLAEPGCQRSDADWGYRPVGDALLAYGTDGYDLLQSFYNQKKNWRLAQMAWLNLYYPQNTEGFTAMTEEQYDEFFQKRPPVYSLKSLGGFTDEWLGNGLWP